MNAYASVLERLAERTGAPPRGPDGRRMARCPALVPGTDSRAWQVYAETHEVRGRTGARFVLLVQRCPRCGCTHIHTARLSFTSGVRTAPCGAPYVVHAAALLEGGGRA